MTDYLGSRAGPRAAGRAAKTQAFDIEALSFEDTLRPGLVKGQSAIAPGSRGEGILHSAPMAESKTINQCDVVAFDAKTQLIVAPADEKNPDGVAAETRTTDAGENPELAHVKHGIAQVTATAAVSAGDAVNVSATAGEVAALADEDVDEGGVATYTISRNEKLGQALQDIAAGEFGDVFVGGA